MMKRIVLVVFCVSLIVLSGCARKSVGRRNPFGVGDIRDPTGADVKAFAAKVSLAGDAKDANAKQWAPTATGGDPASLDGVWYNQWGGGVTSAQVREIGDRVWILVGDGGGGWLVETVRQSDGRLVGRWAQVNNPADGGPFVGVVVDNERIDGAWDGGRWDFRRRIH